MSYRPRLKRNVRVLRRADDSVQIGTGTSDGIVLEHLSDEQFAYLASLDTHVETPTLPPPETADDLLALLDERGLLQIRADAPPPGISGGRTLPRLAIEGAGTLVPTVRAGLAEVGYRIVPATHPRGVAPTRAGAESLARGLAQRADLAVLVDRGGVPFLTGEPWRRAGVPHIPVVFDGPLVTVGPVVEPGGPCLRCLDLTRCDRDPSWPVLLAQVAGYDATDAEEPARTPDDIVAMRLAVAVAVSAVHGLAGTARYVAGRRGRRARSAARPTGAHTSITWRLPGPDVERHEWRVHPRCPAHGASGTMES